MRSPDRALKAQPIPASVIRAAYYMSNWDFSLQTARDEGVVHTLYPADFKLPMVAPHDIAQLAARLLTEPVESAGLHYAEGPAWYSSSDAAAAFAAALGRPVKAVVTPRAQWVAAFKPMGFSDAAAHSYAQMTALTLDQGPAQPGTPVRGSTTLQAHINGLVRKPAAPPLRPESPGPSPPP
jgi:uncharacterized protein YbjT (DUF2867 family)